VSGNTLGSTSLTFEPDGVHAGAYQFAVGSAGSATLVFQTVFLPALMAGSPTTLVLEGGTHNPAAPPFDFLARVFLPMAARMGAQAELTLERHGFYPAGGGRFTAVIQPCAALQRLDLCERGEIRERRVRALIANLPRHIAEREVKKALQLMNWSADCGEVVPVEDSLGPGNVLLLELHAAHTTEVFTGFGETGVPAEAVAGRTVDEVRRYMTTDVPVGVCLADQLLPLMAAGHGGTFRTLGLSRHARTNAEIVQRFCDVRIDTVEEGRDTVRVSVSRNS
jgi:RNA 3'-terminal phosphate cyclase (ATP)